MEIDTRALCDVPDPAERAQQASRQLADYQAAVGELSRIRREALEEMVANGRTQVHRSPMGSGKNKDCAYLGRLPRPDGKGTLLYIAGIHAMGAPGAVHYIENHLTELHSQVKLRRFSMLVSCEFDAKPLKVTASEQLSPVYLAATGR